MPVFTVRRRVDAFIDYTTEVEASSAKEAAELARKDATRLSWKQEGEHEYDAEAFIALDANGDEIADSECGAFA
jgi:hypothetical protein